MTHNLIGWREFVSLPEIGIQSMICKVDTGAKTSALHAFKIETFYKGEQPWVRFWIHDKPDDPEKSIQCESPIIDERIVTDSSGNQTMRYFIETELRIGAQRLVIPMSLTARDTMKYKMLLGRSAIRRGKFLVDPKHSFLQNLQGEAL